MNFKYPKGHKCFCGADLAPLFDSAYDSIFQDGLIFNEHHYNDDDELITCKGCNRKYSVETSGLVISVFSDCLTGREKRILGDDAEYSFYDGSYCECGMLCVLRIISSIHNENEYSVSCDCGRDIDFFYHATEVSIFFNKEDLTFLYPLGSECKCGGDLKLSLEEAFDGCVVYNDWHYDEYDDLVECPKCGTSHAFQTSNMEYTFNSKSMVGVSIPWEHFYETNTYLFPGGSSCNCGKELFPESIFPVLDSQMKETGHMDVGNSFTVQCKSCQSKHDFFVSDNTVEVVFEESTDE